ncbi:hypothetical protein PPERSA_04365 [Pseudocohnilembus persalinus]|uniref:Band 7 domain-containing protein n=1 Tax=Pseudocohnilembus persalinus TaxID=266149 RepID=A0A0V0QQM9_PSEPJ|nr:hypothetical protein PPERSA_04365 [Pseudocohnilembus persalinus]|eukprot:KRX04550.1 hypothetical protein PPERSA_04365 [Pseudocohnilembus persalinus]
MDFSSPQGILVIAATSFIVIILFLLLCWDAVDPTYNAILCNSISKKCDQEDVYSSGRHIVGPFSYFIQFPGSLQTIEFSVNADSPPLQTRTAEGLSLSLSLSFQYQLIKNQLPELYSMNNLNYEQTFIRIARDTILQAAGTYEAPSYWLERVKIGQDMLEELNFELQKAHAHCVYLQILKIELPESYEDSIVTTQVMVQNKKMKEFEQQAQMVLQQIDVLKSETQKQIKSINATAQAHAYQIRQGAEANATQLIIDAEAQAYADAQKLTGLNDQDLNNYIYYLSLMDKQNAKFVVGVNDVFVDARE